LIALPGNGTHKCEMGKSLGRGGCEFLKNANCDGYVGGEMGSLE